MYHFFVEPSQIEEKEIHITGSDVNHIRNVLRMKPGEQICVSSGRENKEYFCEISSISQEEVCASVLEVWKSERELESRIVLFQGLPKSDKMELIIQKAVELGVSEIVPVSTARTVVKLDVKKEQSRLKRWNGISESAAKQSGRLIIPRVTPVMSFQEALACAAELDIKMIPYELAEGMEKTRSLMEKIIPGQSVGIFIGPEGGFEEKEIEKAMEFGVEPVTLGRRILRTETAGLVTLAMLVYNLER